MIRLNLSKHLHTFYRDFCFILRFNILWEIFPLSIRIDSTCRYFFGIADNGITSVCPVEIQIRANCFFPRGIFNTRIIVISVLIQIVSQKGMRAITSFGKTVETKTGWNFGLRVCSSGRNTVDNCCTIKKICHINQCKILNRDNCVID